MAIMNVLTKLWQEQKSNLIPAMQNHSRDFFRRIYGHHLLYIGPSDGFGAIHAAVGYRHVAAANLPADVLFADELPYQNASIDCVVVNFYLLQSNYRALLAEIERVLVAGGTCVIINPHPLSASWKSLCGQTLTLPLPYFCGYHTNMEPVLYRRFFSNDLSKANKYVPFLGPWYILALKKSHAPLTPLKLKMNVALGDVEYQRSRIEGMHSEKS